MNVNEFLVNYIDDFEKLEEWEWPMLFIQTNWKLFKTLDLTDDLLKDLVQHTFLREDDVEESSYINRTLSRKFYILCKVRLHVALEKMNRLFDVFERHNTLVGQQFKARWSEVRKFMR